MTMQDLEGKSVKLSARTITVKDSDGKTRGMVRGVCPFKGLPSSRQFDAFQIVKKSGIWGNSVCPDLINCVFMDGGTLYYLNDTAPLEAYHKYFEGREGWKNEKEHYNMRVKIADQAAQAGMTVINCKIIK